MNTTFSEIKKTTLQVAEIALAAGMTVVMADIQQHQDCQQTTHSWQVRDNTAKFDKKGIFMFAQNTNSTERAIWDAYNRLNHKDNDTLRACEIITLAAKNADTSTATAAFDNEEKVLNVAIRMEKDIIVSISKPTDTNEDNIVMFNVFRKRQLLISDMAETSVLAKLIEKIREETNIA